MNRWWKNIGPGTLVAAAFIGPGTVTVCMQAGTKFGYALLWAMLISIFATIILQEFSARIGLVAGRGISAVLRETIQQPALRWATIVLMISAIVIGNAAYEAGNISGGVLGLTTIFPAIHQQVWIICIGLLAFLLLYFGNYKILERALVGLVIIMSLAFLATAVLTRPNINEILSGLFSFKSPEGSLLTILALVGTTVVPYNLFLHANLVKEKWQGAAHLAAVRWDTRLSIILGGIVSMSIMICAVPLMGLDITNAADMAKGLQPVLGDFSLYFLSLGLFAAGITSAITAPLAAAYVANGCLDWKAGMKDWRFRLVWMLILGLGILFASIGKSPIEIIRFAQMANGLLLPIIAGILLWLVNQSSILGKYKNTTLQNIFGIVVVGFAVFLGAKGIWKVMALIF